MTGDEILFKINNESSTSSVIYTHKIDNMVRRFVIPAGAFLHSSGTLNQGTANPNATATATANGHLQTMRLVDAAVSSISTTFVCPSDMVSNGPYNEPPFSGVTVIWSTPAGSANKRVHCEVRFCKASQITGIASDVPRRYSFKANPVGSFQTDSANPAAYAIVSTRTPENFLPGFDFGGGPQEGYNPGEFVVLTIVRYGASADDPNNGDMFIHGVEIEYHAVL